MSSYSSSVSFSFIRTHPWSRSSVNENEALTRPLFPLPLPLSLPLLFSIYSAAAGSLAVGCILIFLGGLRALRRGTNIEVVGGGYQAPPVVVVTEGDAGRSKSRFKWK